MSWKPFPEWKNEYCRKCKRGMVYEWCPFLKTMFNTRSIAAESQRRLTGGYWPVRGLLAIVTILLGGRAGILFVRYVLGGDVKRYHVESAVLLFAIVAVSALLVTGDLSSKSSEEGRPIPASTWLLWCAGAFALYWSVLGLGFLSDDFVLAGRATRLEFGFVSPEFFRPLPLAMWTIALWSGRAPLLLHGLNVLLHGTNAFLTTRWSVPLLRNRTAATLAGAVVLTMPILVEPVVWCSGVFDVMVTTFVLLSVIAARRYDQRGAKSRIALFGFAIAGLLTKETAIVTPVLILLDAWARGERSKRLHIEVGALILIAGLLGVFRLSIASAAVRQPVTKYIVQRWIFGTFAGLAVPWHVALIQQMPFVPISLVALVLVLMCAIAATGADRRQVRTAIAGAAWSLIATGPTLMFFFVSPNLQNSRYLYLSTAGWALLLASAITAARSRALRFAVSGALLVIVGLGAFGVHRQLGPWQRAAEERDAVEDAARARLPDCHSVAITNPPDSVEGAYIFRNGLSEALLDDVGVTLNANSQPTCTINWVRDRSSTMP